MNVTLADEAHRIENRFKVLMEEHPSYPHQWDTAAREIAGQIVPVGWSYRFVTSVGRRPSLKMIAFDPR